MAQKFMPPYGTASAGAKKPAPKQSMPMAGAPAMGPGEAEPEDGAQIAEQHGPAMEVHHQDDEQMGVHHVTSEHPDGHHHESDHGSKEEAHEHGGKLKGIGKSEEHSEPDGDEEGGWDEK